MRRKKACTRRKLTCSISVAMESNFLPTDWTIILNSQASVVLLDLALSRIANPFHHDGL